MAIRAFVVGNLLVLPFASQAEGTASCCIQDHEPQHQESSNASPHASPTMAPPTALLVFKPYLAANASELMGREIIGKEAKVLGKVSELAIDLARGRVMAVIVSQGGLLGVGQQLRAIPPDSLTYANFRKLTAAPSKASRHLALNMTLEEFNRTPLFDWKTDDHRAQMLAAYRHFKQPAYWEGKSDLQQVRDPEDEAKRAQDLILSSPPQAPPPSVVLVPASALLGQSVNDRQQNPAGILQELVMDLHSGRILFGILASGGVLGMGETIHAIPPRRLAYGEATQKVMLKASRKWLEKAPRFTTDQWSKLNDPGWAAQVYRHFRADFFWGPPVEQPAPATEATSNPPFHPTPKKQPAKN